MMDSSPLKSDAPADLRALEILPVACCGNQLDLALDEEAMRGVRSFRRGEPVFQVCRSSLPDAEVEERYSRKDKSLSQLSKRFLAEFGMASNQHISMFEVTDRLSKFKLRQKSSADGSTTSSTSSRVWASSSARARTTTTGSLSRSSETK